MSKPTAISNLINDYLREQGLEQSILGEQLIRLWPDIMGKQVADLTGTIEIKNQVLMIQIRSAALKQQLFECKRALIKKLNDAVGGEAIKDIRIR